MVYFNAVSHFPARHLGELPTPVNVDRRKVRNGRDHFDLASITLSEPGHPFFDENAVIRPDLIWIEAGEYKYFHPSNRILPLANETGVAAPDMNCCSHNLNISSVQSSVDRFRNPL